MCASIGVAVLIFTNLVLLPILLSFSGVNRKAAIRSLQQGGVADGAGGASKHGFWAFLDLFTTRKYATLAVLVSIALAGMGWAVGTQLKIGDTDAGAPELRPDSRYNRDQRFMVANYAAGSDTYVVMVKTPQFQCGSYHALALVNELENRLKLLPGVESTNSLAALSKVASVGLNEGNMRWFDLPRSQSMLNAIVTRAPRELFNQNCDLLTVYAYLKDHRADTLDSVVAAVESFAAANNTAEIKFSFRRPAMPGLKRRPISWSGKPTWRCWPWSTLP
jgi:uncharacterized protein